MQLARWNPHDGMEGIHTMKQDGMRKMESAQCKLHNAIPQCDPIMQSHNAIPSCNPTMQSHNAILTIRGNQQGAIPRGNPTRQAADCDPTAIHKMQSHDTICVNQSMNNPILQQVISPVSRWSTLSSTLGRLHL